MRSSVFLLLRAIVVLFTCATLFSLIPTSQALAQDEAGFIMIENGSPPAQTRRFQPIAPFSDNSSVLKEAYGKQEGGTGSGSADLAGYINKIFLLSLAIGSLLAVLRLVWAGYQYMASEMWTSRARAKEIIFETLLGLALLFATVLILRQINPQITSLTFSPFKAPSISPRTNPAEQTQSPQSYDE